MLYIDNPFGAGYSFAASDEDYVTTEEQMADNLYFMLQTLAAKHPFWFTREFYITGESYAGKYIPSIAYKILQEAPPNINLAGIAIEDGWTDPYWQDTKVGMYAYSVGLINTREYK